MEEIKDKIETNADELIEEEKTETIEEEAEESPQEQKLEENTLISEIELLKKENYELKKEKLFKERNFDPKYYDMVEKLSDGNLDLVTGEKFEIFRKTKDIYSADTNFKEKEEVIIDKKVEPKITDGVYEYKKFNPINNR